MGSVTKPGRPSVGAPLSIAITDDQRRWLMAQALSDRRKISEIVRNLIDDAMKASTKHS